MHAYTFTEPSADFARSPHPQEDYAWCSAKLGAVIVADGVTLEHAHGEPYPDPSGAAEAAKRFCEAAGAEASRRAAGFGAADLLPVFRAGNAAVGAVNRAAGRVSGVLDYLNVDLFSATVAFALVRKGTLYWFSLCDSFIFIFDAQGELAFASPEPWAAMAPAWRAHANVAGRERKRLMHERYRNAASGPGYGVATGELEAKRWLNQGAVSLPPGGAVAVCTDGFEPFLREPLAGRAVRAGEARVRALSAASAAEDPRFAHERTLAVLLPEG